MLALCFNSIFLHARGGEILPADPASACSSFAAKDKGTDQKTGDASQALPSEDVACTTGGNEVCPGSQMTSPDPETPERKRAKKGGDEEAEEGEIVDSGDEEGEGVAEENPGSDVEAADG